MGETRKTFPQDMGQEVWAGTVLPDASRVSEETPSVSPAARCRRLAEGVMQEVYMSGRPNT